MILIKIKFPMASGIENNINNNDHSENNSEYIRALEMSVNVLKKEVSRLKEKLLDAPGPERENDQAGFFSLLEEISTKCGTNDIIGLINDYFNKNYDMIDCSFFRINSNSEIELVDNSLSSQSLKPLLYGFREQGILDWIFDSRKATVVPNFNKDNVSHVAFCLLIPIRLIPDTRLIFCASSGTDPGINNFQNNTEIKILLTAAASGIGLLDYESELKNCSSKAENIDREIINYSRNAGLGKMFEIFFRQSGLYSRSIKAHEDMLNAGLENQDRRKRIITEETDRLIRINKLYSDLINMSIKYKNTTNLEMFINRMETILDILSRRLGIRLNYTSTIIAEAAKCNPAELFQIILDLFTFLADRLQEAEAVSVSFLMKDNNFMAITISDNNRFASDIDIGIFNPGYKQPGQGLYHIDKLIKKLEGKIELINNENRGITFKVFLPVYNENDNGN